MTAELDQGNMDTARCFPKQVQVEECSVERQDFEALDAQDSLAAVRGRFLLREGLIYMDGNSLGPPCRSAHEHLNRLVDEWRDQLIAGWFQGTDGRVDSSWGGAPTRIGNRIARLIGAKPGEVVVTDGTSVNLFKLGAAALRARAKRHVILTEPGDFPTDRYIVAELAQLFGMRVEQVPAEGLEGALNEEVALVLVTHVNYRTGAIHDMERVTRAVHNVGALMFWDLCHSVGAVPVDLDGCDVDLATGCTYKFLNGGPGSPAFVYMNERLAGKLQTPIPGWIGHADSFQFGETYEPGPGARQWITGTQGMLGFAALEGALEVWDDVDIAAVRSKSILLGQHFIQLLDERCAGLGLEVASPRDGSQRGSHISIRTPHAQALTRALAKHDVVADFRPPDLIRCGLTPLYMRFADIWDAVERIRLLLREMMPKPSGATAVS
ncbi:MAG: kynureninase [Candidatus Dormibacteraceae bacterium]